MRVVADHADREEPDPFLGADGCDGRGFHVDQVGLVGSVQLVFLGRPQNDADRR